MNPLAKQINIEYDLDIYSAIVETGRLVKGADDLRWVHDTSEIEKIADKQIGKDFVFTNKYVFDTEDLGRILKIHTPLEANAFAESTVNNILTLKFYRL